MIFFWFTPSIPTTPVPFTRPIPPPWMRKRNAKAQRDFFDLLLFEDEVRTSLEGARDLVGYLENGNHEPVPLVLARPFIVSVCEGRPVKSDGRPYVRVTMLNGDRYVVLDHSVRSFKEYVKPSMGNA